MSSDAAKPASLRDRIEEIYHRLGRLPRATSAMDAFQQLCEIVDQVEDEMSGIPKQHPPPWPSMPDGRMYCPSDDFVMQRDDGSLLALTRGHRIEIHANGAIRIISKITGQPEFEK